MDGRYSAPSGDDYRDSQEYFGRRVEMTCAECGEPFDVLYSDGPPLGRPLCPVCTAAIEEQRHQDDLRQWVELQRFQSERKVG
jgi:hypothetical protein